METRPTIAVMSIRENTGNYRQANRRLVSKTKLSGEKGQYQPLMLSRSAEERLKLDIPSEGRRFAILGDRTPARNAASRSDEVTRG